MVEAAAVLLPLPLQCLARALHEGQRVVAGGRGLLPLHLHLRLRRQLQLDGARVHLGRRQQLLHALHLLAVEGHHGPAARPHGLLGTGRGRAGRAGAGFGLGIRASRASLGRAPSAPSLANLLGGAGAGGGGGGLGGWGVGGLAGGRLAGGKGLRLLLQSGLTAGAPSATLARVVTRLVVVLLGLGLFGDDGDFLPYLRTGERGK